MKSNKRKVQLFVFLIIIFSIIISNNIFAQENVAIPNINIDIATADTPQETASVLQVLLILSFISLLPSLIILLTSFTRIIISLHFLRAALGTQQMPPNQILLGLTLILTIFIMSPVFIKINDNAFKPYSKGELTQEQFFNEAMTPLREFMFSQVEDKDLLLFTELSGQEGYKSEEDIPNVVLIPAFIIGELTKGFKIGFVIYIPFIVIDMVVASTLMAMGMMMLPPALISAPFKILLFVMVDGWSLIIEGIVRTF